MRDIRSRSGYKIAITVEWGILQDIQITWKDQSLYGSLQVDAETAAGPEATMEWQVK